MTAKPAQFCKLTRQGENVVLTIRQVRPKAGDAIDAYTLEPIPSDFGPGLLLHKHDGTSYAVLLYGTDSTCECKGFETHGWHADADGKPTACKHVMALLKLQQRGKL